MLGLERLLAQDEPHLADGTVLSAHQVDALSGTLIALLRRGPGNEQRNGNGRAPGRGAAHRRGGDRGRRRAHDDEEPLDWDEAEEAEEEAAAGGRARGPRTPPPLLVRARHRRRQDRGRARLRRGLAHRRHPDPHPPPQPGRPVPRRAARPRLPQAHLAAAARATGRAARGGPVTVETYQWFVRNAGKISDAYTIVICDEAHTALGEKTSASIRQLGRARSSSA